MVENVPSDGETRRAVGEFMVTLLKFEFKRRERERTKIVVEILLLAHAYGCIADRGHQWSEEEHVQFYVLQQLHNRESLMDVE